MTVRCPWCNRPAHEDDCHAKLLARQLLDEIAQLPTPTPRCRGVVVNCTHGYNGTATFEWREGTTRFTRADDRICVSHNVADDPIVRDMYEVLDWCRDLPGTIFHAKKWSDR